jgi:thiol-disulfide isomerase/thioredoxin
MSETNEDQLYRIAFGFQAKHCKHTRKEFNTYIKNYYPHLAELAKEWWNKNYIFVNGYKELCVTGKLVDYISRKHTYSPVIDKQSSHV